MSTQYSTDEIRNLILDSIHRKVTSAENIGEGARKDVQQNVGSYERQAIVFMESMARQQVGDELWESYKLIRDAVDPLAQLGEQVEWFSDKIFSYGRVPSDIAGRAYADLHRKYLSDAVRELKSLLKAAKRRSA